MIKRVTAIVAVALVLGLAAADGGKDTPEGCRDAVLKMIKEAAGEEVDKLFSEFEDDDLDNPPAECDDLSTDQQETALQLVAQAAFKEWE